MQFSAATNVENAPSSEKLIGRSMDIRHSVVGGPYDTP